MKQICKNGHKKTKTSLNNGYGLAGYLISVSYQIPASRTCFGNSTTKEIANVSDFHKGVDASDTFASSVFGARIAAPGITSRGEPERDAWGTDARAV